jgi:hypothetical protein
MADQVPFDELTRQLEELRSEVSELKAAVAILDLTIAVLSEDVEPMQPPHELLLKMLNNAAA